jgi:hypothetical protein
MSDLPFDPPMELPSDSPGVSWRGPLPRMHSRAQLQRLRQALLALLAFMAEPLDDRAQRKRSWTAPTGVVPSRFFGWWSPDAVPTGPSARTATRKSPGRANRPGP